MSSRFAAALEELVSDWERAAGASAVLSVNRKMGILEGDEDVLLEVVRALLDRFRDGGGATGRAAGGDGGRATTRGVEIQAFRRADQVLLIVSRASGGESAPADAWGDEILPAAVRSDLDTIGARVHWTREGNGRLQCMVKLGR